MTLQTMSQMGGIMILVITIIRVLFRNKLPKRAFMALWLLAVLRLLLPFTVESGTSVYTAAARVRPMRTARPVAEVVIKTEVADYEPAAVEEPAAPAAPAVAMQAAPITRPVDMWHLAYLSGALLTSAVLGLAYIRSLRGFRRARVVDDPFISAFIAASGLRRSVRVRASALISSPLTYGVVRPVIVLPEELLSNDYRALACVLQHEIVHIRRFDALLKLLFACTACVHFFNPLVWLMWILSGRDMELSCDEAVVKKLESGDRADYALFLLNLGDELKHGAPLLSGFSRHAVRERIEAIMKYKKPSVWAAVLAAALIFALPFALMTSAESQKAASEPEVQLVYDPEVYVEAPSVLDDSWLALFENALTLLDQGYERMSVFEFDRAVENLFTRDEMLEFYLIPLYGGDYDEALYENQPLLDALRLRFDRLYIDPSKFLNYGSFTWDLPGESVVLIRDFDHNTLNSDSTRIGYWLSYNMIDANGVGAVELTEHMGAYKEEMDAFINALSPEAFLRSDALTTLRSEATRLSEKYSTPAVKIRAINFEIDATRDGGKMYGGYSNFFDNTENPPVQDPVNAMVDEVGQLTDMRIHYGIERSNGEGVISPDGDTWYENGYRHPASGASFRYDPTEKTVYMSPDNGGSWYTYLGNNGENSPNSLYVFDRDDGWLIDYSAGKYYLYVYEDETDAIEEVQATDEASTDLILDVLIQREKADAHVLDILDYEDVSVAQYERTIMKTITPSEAESFYNRVGAIKHYSERRPPHIDALSTMIARLFIFPNEEIYPHMYPGDPPGEYRVVTRKQDTGRERSKRFVDYWLGCEITDAEGLLLTTLLDRLDAYTQGMQALVDTWSAGDFFAEGAMDALESEAARLSAELSTPEATILAINFNIGGSDLERAKDRSEVRVKENTLLHFPYPEGTKLSSNESGDGSSELRSIPEHGISHSYRRPRTDEDIEAFMRWVYPELVESYGDYTAANFRLMGEVVIGKYTAVCAAFDRTYQDWTHPIYGAMVKTEQHDFMILLDVGGEDMEDTVKGWLSELFLGEET